MAVRLDIARLAGGLMDAGQRVTLIKKIGRQLSKESSTDIDLTLSAFEFPTEYRDPEELDDYAYTVIQLQKGADAQLGELHRHLFPDDALASMPAAAPGKWATAAFRLFLSHTAKNATSAGNLRGQLMVWGVDTFVAHDRIEPTREWQDEIESALHSCQALAALLTTDFVESRWCDQEVGFAMARGILIVPLKLKDDPHGFIGKYQAVTVRDTESALYDTASAVFGALARSPLTSEAMIPAIVRRYTNSDSFVNTQAAYVLLETIPEDAWTDELMEQIELAGAVNRQVADCVLPGGRSAPEAAKALLDNVRKERVLVDEWDFSPVPSASDEDIPF